MNLSAPDAERPWNLLDEGDAVFVRGTEPGTGDRLRGDAPALPPLGTER
ncbi:hypothetical protein OV450_3118 [Actinobacteria bacterium OV450]|nr:hypothetical protein OV450_3118 [Actinobacteria bacterium OV450]